MPTNKANPKQISQTATTNTPTKQPQQNNPTKAITSNRPRNTKHSKPSYKPIINKNKHNSKLQNTKPTKPTPKIKSTRNSRLNTPSPIHQTKSRQIIKSLTITKNITYQLNPNLPNNIKTTPKQQTPKPPETSASNNQTNQVALQITKHPNLTNTKQTK